MPKIKKTYINDKVVFLKSSVLIEKCSKKYFILNSEKYLNSIGIAIYIWSEKELTEKGYKFIYSSSLNSDNLGKQIEIYGIDCLTHLYKKLTSNKRLIYLPHCQYLIGQIGIRAFSQDFNLNYIVDIFGEEHEFRIYCMTKNIVKSAGYFE